MNNRPKQAYCIIQSSQAQVEHTFLAGCYFYTKKLHNFKNIQKKG
nr:MAG TPA: hypothetical protein [Caudoviricetes sp.]